MISYQIPAWYQVLLQNQQQQQQQQNLVCNVTLN